MNRFAMTGTVFAGVLLAGSASAQVPTPAGTSPATTQAASTSTGESTDTAAAPEAAAEAAAPAEAPAQPAAAAETPPPASAEPPATISTMFFVDAFANVQSAQGGTGVPWHRAYDSQSPGSGSRNGFGLAFAGGDISLAGKGFGLTTSVRFGPAVPLFYAADTSPLGIENITQAYATVSPVENLVIDVGQFGTIYGAEVAESWRNKNYTRGGLYYGMQPFWHTGARVGWTVMDSVKLTAMAVNGTNSVALDAKNVNIGLQAAYTSEIFSILLGTLQAADGATNPLFDRFFDIVATLTLGDFSAVLNLDYNINETKNFSFAGNSFSGASLAGAYQFGANFGVAARAEYLQDADNALYAVVLAKGESASVDVATGTVTFDVRPLGNSNLVIRWDNRMEWSNKDIYANADGKGTGLWFTSVLGLVVNTEGL